MLAFEPIHGSGVWLEDDAGRRMLDFYGGHAVAALGYSHPKLHEVLVRQIGQLQFQSNLVPMRVRDRGRPVRMPPAHRCCRTRHW